METIQKKAYKGIEYIQLSDLNEELRSEIENWLSDDVLITIKKEHRIIRNCIQTKDFIYWYENLYTAVNALDKETKNKPMLRHEPVSLVLER
jgi:hypothetical protein